jgi:predicted N-formylglutamate amidohydrolase
MAEYAGLVRARFVPYPAAFAMPAARPASPPPLLGPDEPPAFAILRPDGASRLVLLCDHASNRVPAALDRLGLRPRDLAQHIGWDIGAAMVAKRISFRFDAPLAMTGYSRLVIDCNRRLDHATSVPAVSDGVVVPGNRRVGARQRARRRDALFRPYHAAVAALLKRRVQEGPAPVIASIHSCTPVMNGFKRPWHVGVLSNVDRRLADPVLAALARVPGIVVGDNEPYSGKDGVGYTIATHAEKPGLPHVSFEIRQDLIATPIGALHWARLIGGALAAGLKALK